MNKFWTILSHTFMNKIKAKSFIITTVLVVLAIFALSNIQTITGWFENDADEEVAIKDESGEMLEPLETINSQSEDSLTLITVDESLADAKKAVQDEEYEVLVALEEDQDGLPTATMYASKMTGSLTQDAVIDQLQQLKTTVATQKAGVAPEQLQEIYAPMDIDEVALDESAKSEEELSRAQVIVYALITLMFFVVMLYGSLIANDVATEKSSRVMEILISSAPPVTHLFAKVIGMTLVGLLQIVIFIGAGYAFISGKLDELTGEVFDFGIQHVTISLIIYAIVFFLLGFLLYGTLAAVIGSLVSRVEEVQQMIVPLIFLILIGFYIAIFGMTVPDAALITVSSYIPFFSPMVMFLRIGMLDTPVWEIALSIGILVATIALLGIIGARIYRGGVLLYGSGTSLKDIPKALALSKKE